MSPGGNNFEFRIGFQTQIWYTTIHLTFPDETPSFITSFWRKHVFFLFKPIHIIGPECHVELPVGTNNVISVIPVNFSTKWFYGFAEDWHKTMDAKWV